MTYQIATILSCLLFPLIAWLASSAAKRTIYRPITSEEGQQRDEQGERDKVKNIREKNIKRLFTIYGVLAASFFIMAALAGPARKVHAALWPSATPTATNTRTPTRTPTATNTPRATNTRNPNNFLTTVSTTGTVTGTVRPSTLVPSGDGGGSVIIVQTRIVVQTKFVPVTQIVTQIIYVPVTVTYTPLPSSEPATSTSTETPTATVTLTPTVTPTETETPEP